MIELFGRMIRHLDCPIKSGNDEKKKGGQQRATHHLQKFKSTSPLLREGAFDIQLFI